MLFKLLLKLPTCVGEMINCSLFKVIFAVILLEMYEQGLFDAVAVEFVDDPDCEEVEITLIGTERMNESDEDP